MRRAPLILALSLVLAACGAAAPSAKPAPREPAVTAVATTATTPPPPARPAAERHPPVVMVVFDEFSFASLLNTKGRIDPELYPHLTQLARQADVYPHYTTPSDETTSLFAALL